MGSVRFSTYVYLIKKDFLANVQKLSPTAEHPLTLMMSSLSSGFDPDSLVRLGEDRDGAVAGRGRRQPNDSRGRADLRSVGDVPGHAYTIRNVLTYFETSAKYDD